MRTYVNVSLPRRPPKNPQPCINPVGDCGACVLAGVMGFSVEQAYEEHESGYYGRGPLDPTPAREIEKRSAFSYHSMRSTLNRLHADGRLDRAILDTPVWLLGANVEMNGSFGPHAGVQSMEVERYWLAMFDAGYYGITQVVMHGGGIEKSIDHWVMLCGYRQRVEDGDSRIYQEFLIGDSALSYPQERWIDTQDFLRSHGGFMAFFARPLPT